MVRRIIVPPPRRYEGGRCARGGDRWFGGLLSLRLLYLFLGMGLHNRVSVYYWLAVFVSLLFIRLPCAVNHRTTSA